jgi:hypothetical protein
MARSVQRRLILPRFDSKVEKISAVRRGATRGSKPGRSWRRLRNTTHRENVQISLRLEAAKRDIGSSRRGFRILRRREKKLDAVLIFQDCDQKQLLFGLLIIQRP